MITHTQSHTGILITERLWHGCDAGRGIAMTTYKLTNHHHLQYFSQATAFSI